MPTIISGDTGVNQITAGAIEKADLPTGSVLQVVQGTSLTDTTITSTSYTDTTLTASITPTSSSSKILVIITQAFLVYREATEINGGMQIVRGSTAIASHNITPSISAGLNTGSSIATRGTWAMTYLDSPATTSSTTYKTQAKVSTTANSGQIRLQQNSTEISTITLMEIAA
jgi:hypothetical protein